MKRINMRTAKDELRYMEPFQTWGNLSAVAGSVSNTGQMPDDWAQAYRAAHEADAIAYTVLSFETPIAWVTDRTDTVVVPGVKYSVTTSKHQNYARAALCTSYRRSVVTLAGLSAPHEDLRPAVSPQSGEGALYSPEYLRSKTPATA